MTKANKAHSMEERLMDEADAPIGKCAASETNVSKSSYWLVVARTTGPTRLVVPLITVSMCERPSLFLCYRVCV